eukprot:scaffold345346_cov18-Prasinocladus_malaysianus.AAC.1
MDGHDDVKCVTHCQAHSQFTLLRNIMRRALPNGLLTRITAQLIKLGGGVSHNTDIYSNSQKQGYSRKCPKTNNGSSRLNPHSVLGEM